MSNERQGSAPAIVVEGLVKRFGDIVAVDRIDFTVPKGTVLGLLGPNGAGKTTTVRVLTTILRPDAGRATVLGLDVAKRPHAVRSVIGLTGQFAAVDEALTGRENLRMISRLTHQPTGTINQRADELLGRFGLSSAADRPVRTYSGGMHAGGSTWVGGPWCTLGPRCCSWTSPRPVLTRPGAAICGPSSANWWRTARHSC